MHHDMLDAREALFYGVMHMLRNFVGIAQCRIPVRTDFNVHINSVAKDPCSQLIHAMHALL